jgi:hypothetical protein
MVLIKSQANKKDERNKMTILDWFKNKSKPEEIPKHIAVKKSRKKKD